MASSGRQRQTRPAVETLGRQRGRVVSQAPGRVRVRLHPEHRTQESLQQIERDIGSRDAVSSVSTNVRTGSVLVHYDHHALSREDLRAMLVDVGIVGLDLLGADEVAEEPGGERSDRGVVAHSVGATGVLDALTDLDYRVSQLTGGKVDLKLLVPVGLGLLAIRQIWLNGLGLGVVPGYVLLWYTFDSFYKLHQRKTDAAVKDLAEDFLGGVDEARGDE